MVPTVRYGKSFSLTRVRVIGHFISKNLTHSNHTQWVHLGWHQIFDNWYSRTGHTSYNWNSHVRRNSVLCIVCVHCFRVEWHSLLLLMRSVCLYRWVSVVKRMVSAGRCGMLHEMWRCHSTCSHIEPQRTRSLLPRFTFDKFHLRVCDGHINTGTM